METKKLHINTLDFAQKELAIQGELSIVDLPRLQTLVLNALPAKTVHYMMRGQAGGLGLPGVHLHVDADLLVTCQRCLSEMPLPLRLDFDYVVSKDSPEGLDEQDEVDWLEAKQDFDVVALIEDELLLAMPIAPTHGSRCMQRPMESGEKSNPFAVLKELKTNRDD
jgi:uncharacterized protein